MADEKNDALLQEINELLDKLKTFPQNRDEATDDQKREITEIYKKIYEKDLSVVRATLTDDDKKATFNNMFETYKEEAREAFNSQPPLSKLKRLPKENINDSHRNAAKGYFEELFKQIANDYKLSDAEKNILATYMPIFGAEAQSVLATMQNRAEIIAKLNAQAPKNTTPTPQPMSEEDKAKVTDALTKLKTKLYNRDGNPKNFSRERVTRTSLRDALKEFSTDLDGIQGEFTPEQITELQGILQPFRENSKLKIDVDNLLLYASVEHGNKYTPTPAFTQLYTQLNPNYQADKEKQELANELNDRLRNAFANLTVDNEDQNDTTGEPEVTPDDEHQDDQETDQPEGTEDEHQDAPDLPDVPVADEDEIKTYLDEVRQSNTEDAYISGINPKIKPNSIEASMNLDAQEITITRNDGTEEKMPLTATQARALALSNPDDLLIVYQHYTKNSPEKIADVEDVIAESLKQIDPQNLNPDNAFVYLTLADKIKNRDEYKATYDAFSASLTSALKQYDTEHFGTKTPEELAENFVAAKEGLEQLSPAFLQTLVQGYNFTDDKGKPLTDKNRGKLNPRRWTSGKGNDLSDTMESLFETARLMAAQELAAEGLPKDPDLRKQALESKMREQMSAILHLKVDPVLIEAASLLPKLQKEGAEKKLKEAEKTRDEKLKEINEKYEADKAKIEEEYNKKTSKKSKEEKQSKLAELETQKNKAIAQANQAYQTAEQERNRVVAMSEGLKQKFLEELLAGDIDTMKVLATIHARTEMGLPADQEPDFGKDEAKKREYLNKQSDYLTALNDGHQKSTTFTKSEIAARLGGVMAKTEQFHIRTGQHYKGQKIEKVSRSFWQRVDTKLTEKLGKPYTESKKWAKTIGKMGWNMAKTMAITSAVIGGFSALGVGALGVAAVSGYYAVKTIKGVAAQWKQAESTSEKVALIAGAAISTAFTTATAIAGFSGAESAIGQFTANFTQSIGGKIARGGIVGLATSSPLLIKAYTLKKKSKKLDEEIAKETDPLKLKQLQEKRKQLQIKRQKNNENLIIRGIGVTAGVTAGSLMSANASEHTSDTQTPQTPTTPEVPVTPVATDTLDVTPGNIPQFQAGFGGLGNFSTPWWEMSQHGNGANPNFNFFNDTLNQNGQDTIPGPVGYGEQQDTPPTDAGTGNEGTEGTGGSETLTPEQQAEANLNEAKTAGTGWRGQSSYDSVHNNLNDYGMDDQQVDATTQKMCEVYGDDAYKATHAALAEPAHLASAMGLTNQDLGLQPGETLTSAKMLDYLQNHDMSGNSGFNDYMSSHFHTDQQLFTPSEQPAHINSGENTHHNNPPVNTGGAGNGAGTEPPANSGGFHYEPVNHLPGEQHPQQPPIHTSGGNNYPPTYAQHQPQYMRVPQYSDVLEGKVNSNGYTTTGIVVDPRTGKLYEEQISPAGTIRYNPRTEQNVIEECQGEFSNPSMRVRYAAGPGYIGRAPNSVDKVIDIAHASIDTAQGIAHNLEHMGVLNRDTAGQVFGAGNIAHLGLDLVDRIRNTRA